MEAFILAALLVATPVPLDPDITFWYGPDQVFGELGNPQYQINILGNVQSEAGLMQLSYSLDGGPELPLNFGPDTRRLLHPGDFNIELFLDDLAAGGHEVVVRAVDNDLNQVSKALDFTVMPESVWPIPYTAKWALAPDVPSAAQPVDGRWVYVAGGVRCPLVGYDRLLAIGDTTWTNYEVRVPITIHSIDPAGYNPPSITPGIGIVMRWTGHTDTMNPGSQPSVGYWPVGGVGEYVYHLDQCGARLQLYGNQFILGDQDDECEQLQFNVTYIWKMRVQTLENGTHEYKLKVWEQGQGEPSAWKLSMIEDASQPANGCLLLLAHHVDATFGNVKITFPGEDPVPPADEVLIRSRAKLFGHSNITGKSIYRELIREGELMRRFNVTVKHAAPGQIFAVHLGGAFVDAVQADQTGLAVLEMRTPAFIDDPETQVPMPNNFPTIVDLETVSVGMLSGVFFDAIYTLPDGADLIGPQYRVMNEFVDDDTGMNGKVIYRERIKNGELDRRLLVHVFDGVPNSWLWFRIHGNPQVAPISFDANGFGMLEMRTPSFIQFPGIELPMPISFPSLLPGEIVRIGNIPVELEE
jgi:hypothetical protein